MEAAEAPPNQTLYVNNLYERLKKDGTRRNPRRRRPQGAGRGAGGALPPRAAPDGVRHRGRGFAGNEGPAPARREKAPASRRLLAPPASPRGSRRPRPSGDDDGNAPGGRPPPPWCGLGPRADRRRAGRGAEMKKVLHCCFSQFGKILDVVVMSKFRLRGQAWVVFDEIEAATKALKGLQGFPLYEKPIKIQYAYDKSDAIA